MPVAIVLVALIIAVFFTWYFKHKSLNDERLLLIQKGVDFEKLPEQENLTFSWLKVGCAIIFAFLGTILVRFFGILIPGFQFLSLIFFGGIGVLIAHYLEAHYLEKSNDKS
jgi:nitrogen fixation-related uncharacterized protein